MRRLAVAVLLVTVALVGCAGGGDDDSLPADAEAQGWSVAVTYPNGTEHSYNVTSDPTQTDTDGDGMNDFQELDRGSDPRDVDTDQDRLLDGPTQCPESGSDLEDRVLERGIVEHPERTGCYLGEARTEIGEMSYSTSPVDAHSDSSPQLSDRIDDGTELVGWEVEPADGESFHVRSNPSLRNADTDRDGLHDGLEKQLATDPTTDDTDGDGVNDYNDAAPLGDLKVTVHVLSMNLKTDYKQVSGGADLLVDATSGDAQASRGPQGIDKGDNDLDWSLDLDVNDQGSDFTNALGGAYAQGNWEKEIRLRFVHDSGDGDPIEVRTGSENSHLLILSYDAFQERWTGHASGGTTSGPDADVTIDVSSRVE